MNLFNDLNFDERIIRTDSRHIKELEYFFQTNTAVKQCVDIIRKFLFNDVTVDGAKDVLKQYCKHHIRPFFQRSLNDLITVGWFCYQIITIKDNNGVSVNVPQVVPREFVDVQLCINKKNFIHKFKVFQYGDEKELKNVKVFSIGMLTSYVRNNLVDSVLDSVLGDLRFVQQIYKFTLQAEYIRSNPTIFLRASQAHPSTSINTGNGTRGRPLGTLTSEVAGVRDRIDRQLPTIQEALSKASEDIGKNVEFHNNQLSSLCMKDSRNFFELGHGLRAQYEDNLYICPPNMELAATPRMPESRVDLAVMRRDLTSKVYQAFGIPESVAGFTTGSNVRGTSGSSTRPSRVRTDANMIDIIMFEATVEKYKSFYKDCFVQIYSEVFKKKIPSERVILEGPELYNLFLDKSIFGLAKKTEDSDDENTLDESENTNSKRPQQDKDDDKKNKVDDNLIEKDVVKDETEDLQPQLKKPKSKHM